MNDPRDGGRGSSAGLDFGTAAKSFLVPAALVLCIIFSLLMLALKPIPHGHGYGQALKLSLGLAVIWFVYAIKPHWVFRKAVLAVVLAAGLGLGIGGFATIDPDAEVVHVYDSVFRTIESGGNPYTSGTIFHRGEDLRPVYGNFNYPPMEIYPYYLAHLIAGTWDSAVLTAVMLILQALVCLVFLRTFPEIRLLYLLPFAALFLLGEIKINPAMTFLVTALILLFAKKDLVKPRPAYRYVVAVLFGIGLMTKFLIIPLMAAYYWNKFDGKRLRSLVEIAVDLCISLGTAVLIMVPYGVAAVFKNTILFNLILQDRASLTTFYPNVLSGFFTWVHLPGAYPVAAVAILGLAVLMAPRLTPFSAMLTAVFTFLLVAPVPKAQFLYSVLYLAVAGIYVKMAGLGEIPESARKRIPAG